MILKFIIFAAVGKLCIFFLRKFPLTAYIIEKVLKRGFFCDLCLGTWVYLVLAWFFRMDVFELGVPILSQVLTGAFTSFIVYLISIGWTSEFSIVEVG